MSRVGMFQTSLRRIHSLNDTLGLQFFRAASTQTKATPDDTSTEMTTDPPSASPPPSASTPTESEPSKPPNPDAFLFEKDPEDDDDGYRFANYRTPKFTAEEKDYLDVYRPKVDPRLSTVFRGYTSMDEGTWTIPYSKKSWYTMKQIYGHYDEVNDKGTFYLHPRSLMMRVLRDPLNLKKDSFDTWKERRDVDICKGFQIVDPTKLAVLGPELLAAHFVTSFGGKVKFHGFQNWFDSDSFRSLPQKYGPEFVCEAIDLSGTPLFYEGLGVVDGEG